MVSVRVALALPFTPNPHAIDWELVTFPPTGNILIEFSSGVSSEVFALTAPCSWNVSVSVTEVPQSAKLGCDVVSLGGTGPVGGVTGATPPPDPAGDVFPAPAPAGGVFAAPFFFCLRGMDR